jgi:putative ATPase
LQAVVARGIEVLAEERDLPGLSLDPEAEAQLLRAADGDARRALNMLEMAVDLVQADASSSPGITAEQMREIGTQSGARFDKGGEAFYDQISALHKSVRGSDPDAALYWCARMLEGGCDPVYLARRLVRIASEDVGNADPRALPLCVSAWDAYLRLGSPEGELALAHAVAYLAVAPKSNAVYTAFGEAWRDAREQGSLEVPLHLRNAPTELMRELGYGAEYRYDPDEPGGHAAGQTYLPEALRGRRYYRPRAAGLEIQIGQRLAALRAADEKK